MNYLVAADIKHYEEIGGPALRDVSGERGFLSGRVWEDKGEEKFIKIIIKHMTRFVKHSTCTCPV